MSESKREEQHVERVQQSSQPVNDDKISYIGLVPVFMDITFATYSRMLTSPFHGSKAHSYRRDVFYATLREIVSGFSVAEGQKIVPNTDKVYRRIAKSKRWKEHTVDLGNGAKGHWLGHSDAKYVMVYFHGGGYISAATYGHLKYQFALQKDVRKMGHDFSIFSLSYTLAPDLVYPGQIGQAASAIRYFVEEQKRDPSTIIIAGDSAGGNLTAALLLHLARPHPKLPKLELKKPLRAAIMISPWICFRTNLPSFTNNKHSDYLTPTAIDRASNTYIGPGGSHDSYSEPRRAPVSWWSDVARKAVQEVFIWGGGGEILIDGIRDFAVRVHHGFRQATVASAKKPEPKVNGHAVQPKGEDDIEISPIENENGNGALRPDSEALPSPDLTGDAFIEPKSTTDLGEFQFEFDKELPHCETCRCHSHKGKGRKREGSGNLEPEIHAADRVAFVETPKMAHEEMIIDFVLFIRGKREGAKVIERWMDQILKG